MRLTPDGAPDATFGKAAKSAFACGGQTSAPSAMAAGTDGSVFALVTGPLAVTYLAKLTPSGALDTSFGKSGCATWSFGEGGRNFQAKRIELDSGAIWLSGSIKGADRYDHGAVVKLLQGGVLDSTFGKGGLVELVPSSEPSNDVVVATHASGAGLLVLNSRYLQAQVYERDLIRLDAKGKRSENPVVADSGFLDFAIAKDGLNLYYLKSDLAGRIATP